MLKTYFLFPLILLAGAVSAADLRYQSPQSSAEVSFEDAFIDYEGLLTSERLDADPNPEPGMEPPHPQENPLLPDPNKPYDVVFQAPLNAFVTDPVQLKAILFRNGKRTDPMWVEFLWSEDGESWENGTEVFEIHSDEVGPKKVYISALYIGATDPNLPPPDPVKSEYSVIFKPIMEPRVWIDGPLKAEAGETYTWKGSIEYPYPGMDNGLIGMFVMPNGTAVNSSEITYTVTEEDVEQYAGKMIFNFTGWVDGFDERGAVKSINFASRTWKYTWPEFGLRMRKRSSFAPSLISLKAVQVGDPVALLGPVYEWTLPEEVIVRNSDKPDERLVEITEPGDYVVEFTVSDDRGSTQSYAEVIQIKEAPAYELDVRLTPGKGKGREPYNLKAKAIVKGGHRADRIKDITFKINGEVVPDKGNSMSYKLQAGQHVLTVELDSELGQHVSRSYPISVTPNQLPACELDSKELGTTWVYTALCDDPDGRVVKYKWRIAGKKQGRSSVRMAVPKSFYDEEPEVQVIAVDDAGGASLPAMNM